MNKVVVFVGSARKGHSLAAAESLRDHLAQLGAYETEIVVLGDHDVRLCRGCKVCFDKGEERCPFVDDRELLVAKIEGADGVVIATPNYAFHVSAHVKAFLDRIAYILHRPRFFGKTFTSIVAQGVFGGAKIIKYLDMIAGAMGFNTIKGACINTLEPMSAEAEAKGEKTIAALSKRFHAAMNKPAHPAPGLLALFMFRFSRTRVRLMLSDEFRDYTYYREQGWFESDFYYATRLGPVMRLMGALFDRLAAAMTR